MGKVQTRFLHGRSFEVGIRTTTPTGWAFEPIHTSNGRMCGAYAFQL